MDSREVIEALEEARSALQEYRDEFEGKSTLEKRSSRDEKDKIEEEADLLIKESRRFIAGPSGDTCPRCGGTGRV